METNTFFDSWLETQKQLMNNWTESNKKLQESVKTGAALTDGMTIYKEWLNKQAEITKAATEQASKTFQSQVAETAGAMKNGTTTANVSEIYTNWMNAQKEQMTKAFENFKNFAQPLTSNNQFANNSFEQFQNFTQQFWNNSQNWMNQTNQFVQPWTNQFQNWGKGLNDSTLKDAWSNMTNSSAAFVKFYEMWSPMLKNMQNNTFNAEWMKNTFNADAFRELMDRTMANISPVQTKELFAQFQNWVEMANNYSKHAYQQMAGNVPENFKNLTPFLLFGNDPTNTANNAFAVYQRAVGPVVKLFYPGKESELNDLVSGMMEKVSAYGQKLAELQQQLYVNGSKTWEKFLFDNADQLKKGADLSNIQEQFQNWINKNEESMIELFKTDAFSKIQGELLDLGLDIRQRSEKVAETLLQPLPIMLRSEADELYTTIYELRKRLSALEKQVETENTSEVKEAKSSKKKTATA